MPNPKRRHSHARGAKRRTHYKLEAPGLSRCRQCGELHHPHRACANCGFYQGKRIEQAIAVRKKEDE